MRKIFLHVIANCSHSVSLASMLATMRDSQEHQILMDPSRFHKENFFELTRRIFPSTSLLENSLNLQPWQVVIFHGIFSQAIFNIVRQVVDLPCKTVWVLWGGDARLLKDTSNLAVLNKLDYVICAAGELVPHPELSVPEITGVNLYKNPDIEVGQIEKEDLIVLGNSGDPSNDHQYLLRLVAGYKKSYFHVPFAYNGSREYLRQLENLTELLGIRDRVHFQVTLKSHSEYRDLFMKAKAYLSAHNRQQSFGTLRIAYVANCKVYLRKTILRDDGNTMTNPSFVQALLHGLPDLNSITDLEEGGQEDLLLADNSNSIHDLHMAGSDHTDRVFEILKRQMSLRGEK